MRGCFVECKTSSVWTEKNRAAQPTEPSAQDELGVVVELELIVAEDNGTRIIVGRHCDQHEGESAGHTNVGEVRLHAIE